MLSFSSSGSRPVVRTIYVMIWRIWSMWKSTEWVKKKKKHHSICRSSFLAEAMAFNLTNSTQVLREISVIMVFTDSILY